ncbi:MAG TPA: ornithine carbamoyltransferase [Bacillota bacterium]|jgi:ornithine carbamoyltransferase|nr:ornithine carbamoyltransferase [Bacillota bacterium]HQD78338.1 ornithine carbamoyltransferase [Bacillota bacterium]
MLGSLKGRDFLSLKDYSKEEIYGLLKFAAELRKDNKKYLKGKVLGMIFAKNSTRTRISFEVGMLELGGHAIFLSDRDIQLARGETIADTARVLSRYLDGIMIRTFSQGDVEELAKWATIPVINGLTDYDHPCQALADLLTIKDSFGTLSGKLAYIGDGNNMATALIFACAKVGMEIAVASPEGFQPDNEIVEYAKKIGGKVLVTADPAEAARGANVLYTDVWTSMGQEEEMEKRRKAFVGYQVNEKLMELADPKAIFLHCLPAHRGEEVTDQVIEGHQSRVFDQAENRLHAQKAVLAALL